MDRLLHPLLAAFATGPGPVRMRDSFAAAWRDGHLTLFADCVAVATGSPGRIANRLLQEANLRFVSGARTYAAHAGVVGRGDRLVAVVGDSGSGKSTLVAAALLEGWAYGSDEALCVGPDLTVVPYPKPLGLSAWAITALGIDRLPAFDGLAEVPTLPAALAAEVVGQGCRLTDLVIPTVEPGAGPELAPIPPSEVMSALIVNSFNHYRDPEGTFRLTSELARTVNGWRLVYGDPGDAARLLTRRLANR